MPWDEGRCSAAEPTRCPKYFFFKTFEDFPANYRNDPRDVFGSLREHFYKPIFFVAVWSCYLDNSIF